MPEKGVTLETGSKNEAGLKGKKTISLGKKFTFQHSVKEPSTPRSCCWLEEELKICKGGFETSPKEELFNVFNGWDLDGVEISGCGDDFAQVCTLWVREWVPTWPMPRVAGQFACLLPELPVSNAHVEGVDLVCVSQQLRGLTPWQQQPKPWFLSVIFITCHNPVLVWF